MNCIMASKPLGNLGGWSGFWYTIKPVVSMLVVVWLLSVWAILVVLGVAICSVSGLIG